ARRGNCRKAPPRTERAALAIKIVGINPALESVREIERAAVDTPVDPIGDDEADLEPLDREIRVEAVEMTRALLLLVIHAAGPEATRRIDLAVVEAVAGMVGLGIDDRSHGSCGQIDESEAALERRDQTRPLAEGDGADPLGHGPAPSLPRGDVGRKERGSLDVDPIERARP